MLLTIMLDAFNPKYLGHNTPFMRDISQTGSSGVLVPSYGFEPDAAYVSGLYPEQCDGGTLYWRNPGDSPFGWTKYWGSVVGVLPQKFQWPFRRGVQVMNLLFRRDKGWKYLAAPGNIPFHKLPEFGIAQKKLMFEPGFTPSPTIFDLLTLNRRSWKYFGYPVWRGSIDKMYRRLRRENLTGLDYAFLMLADLDFTGHRYGTQSDEMGATLRQVDTHIEMIYHLFAQQNPDVELLIFGDHGMVDVENVIDMEAVLSGLHVRRWQDYSYFLDSTFARFWFHIDAAREEITARLLQLDGGSVVSDEDRRSYRAAYAHNRFGDLIFWADGGTVISPDFFRGGHVAKGMHGYRREVADNHAAVLYHDPAGQKKLSTTAHNDMVSLFPTMLELLSLPEAGGLKIPSLLTWQ